MAKVIVSGAGLVGATLAIAMKKRGHDVTLIEKRSDMRASQKNGGRSINLVVTSRGLNAFKSVGLLEDVLSLTVPVYGRMMHSLAGELTYQPYGKEDECNYSISRSELNILLLDKAEQAGVKILFSHSSERLDLEKKIALFQGGESLAYDLFYACDGVGSPIRKQLPHKNWIDDLGADYKEMSMPMAKNGDYAIEKNALHIWPRTTHMLMALPNTDGSFTMTLYMPRKDNKPSFENINSTDEVTELFEHYYSDAASLMPEYLDEFNNNPQGILGTVRSECWVYKDSVALLGDAAHGIVPFFGQGMNCGVEDITYLLKAHDLFPNDTKRAFEYYDQTQRPNGHAIADMAIENYIEMRDKVGNDRFLLKKKISHKIETTWPELYRSRYGMVTYTLVPYSLCQKAGLIQEEILEELACGIDGGEIEQLDLNKAKLLLDQKFVPFVKEHGIDLSRYSHSVN